MKKILSQYDSSCLTNHIIRSPFSLRHLPQNSKNKHVIAFDLYGKGNKQCVKKKEGTYLMDVGAFSRAYVAQKQIDYYLVGNEYGGVDALDYAECTEVDYNDVAVSVYFFV